LGDISARRSVILAIILGKWNSRGFGSDSDVWRNLMRFLDLLRTTIVKVQGYTIILEDWIATEKNKGCFEDFNLKGQRGVI